MLRINRCPCRPSPIPGLVEIPSSGRSVRSVDPSTSCTRLSSLSFFRSISLVCGEHPRGRSASTWGVRTNTILGSAFAGLARSFTIGSGSFTGQHLRGQRLGIALAAMILRHVCFAQAMVHAGSNIEPSIPANLIDDPVRRSSPWLAFVGKSCAPAPRTSPTWK